MSKVTIENTKDAVTPEEEPKKVDIAELFSRLRQFQVELEDGTIREAMIRLATPDESRRAEEYALSVVAEKSKGEPDPITGRVIKLPLRVDMMEYAKEKGLWTEEDEMKFATLEAQLKIKIDRLVRGEVDVANGDAHNLALQIYQHRQEIFPYNQRRWAIYELTADAAGENAMHQYLCVATAEWENGERIFPDIKAFEKNTRIRNQVLSHYLTIMRVQNDYVAPLDTEIGFFRDFSYMDEAGNIYDHTRSTVLMNIYGSDEPEETGEYIWKFKDQDGNEIKPTGFLKKTDG